MVRLLFRPRLEGLEHLPTDRPYLLVANHSAGVGAAELVSFAVCWAEATKGERALAPFAHRAGFAFPPMAAVHRHLGSVPSTYEAAYAALDSGAALLVFPGGDYESLQPVWHRNRVDFAGRKGFVRIAREKNVPIVPLGIRGGATTAPILLRAGWLAYLLILPRVAMMQKRWGISLLGVVGSAGLVLLPLAPWVRALLVWFWLASPLSCAPIFPGRLRLRIGPALEPETLFDGDDLSAAVERVQAAVQAEVDAPDDGDG